MALYVSCGREADACWASLSWLGGSDFCHEIYPAIGDTAESFFVYVPSTWPNRERLLYRVPNPQRQHEP
jgi:hypothetical protein